MMSLLAFWIGGAASPTGTPPPTPVVTPPPGLGGSKKKKVRGPYSDPRIFEEYVARCIAERNAPRVDTVKAQLQEALLHEVEIRREQDIVALDTLIRENEALTALLAFERGKRDIAALKARAQQIERQVAKLQEEHDDMQLFTALWHFME